MTKKLAATAVAALLVLGVTACGDDDTDDEAAATTEAGSGGQDEYCAIEAEIDALFNEAFSGTEPPTAEEVAAVSQQVIDEFGDVALAAAPEEIADDVTVLFGATEEAADGNPAAFDTPEVQAAGEAVDEFCGLTP